MSKGYRLICSIICLVLLVPGLYGENQGKIIVQTPFKPIKKVYPEYPEILKNEGVAARFSVLISIDKKGNVRKAFLGKSLYPELEKSIEEAFIQWKFEPFTHRGEPVGTFGFIKIIFYPGKSRSAVQDSETAIISINEELTKPPNEELQIILDKCTEYTLRLSESALHYICHEKITDRFKRLEEKEIGIAVVGHIDLYPDEIMKAENKDLILTDSERHTYVYDYQLIRKKGHIEEKRILMEKNTKEVRHEDLPQAAKPIYSLKSILVPVKLLGIEERPNYSFRLAKDEKIKGKLVYVIEAFLKPRQTGNIKKGRIWVDKSDFRVVKVEVETDFVEGFEQILSECYQYYLKPHFISTHFYEIEKNDVLFPSRSKIRVEYSGLLTSKKEFKAEVDVSYGNYQFFTVETDYKIIKKKMETLFLARGKMIFNNSLRFIPCVSRYF